MQRFFVSYLTSVNVQETQITTAVIVCLLRSFSGGSKICERCTVKCLLGVILRQIQNREGKFNTNFPFNTKI